MVKRFLAVCASLGLCVACAAEEANPAPRNDVKIDAAAVAKFVAQLGSDRYADRETASKQLDALGQIALEALRPALSSHDEETRRRAADLTQHIEKRLESNQLTRPKLVRLVYTDLPVDQAVQDIARKTGFTIQIDGDQTKIKGRKITLDTGEVPFWQAMDQFCVKAGLVERGSQAIAETNEMDQMRMERMRGRMWMMDQQGGAGPRPELPVVLLDGNAQALPTYYGGALRVRVLPKAAANAAATPNNGTPVNRADGETLLTVEVTPEPKMGWQNVLSVRIDRMIDEHGNEMKPPLPFIRDTYDFDEEDLAMGMRSYKGYGGPQQTNLSKQVPLRVHGLKDMKKIKELHGAVAAEVFTPMQPLVTIDDILNATGKADHVTGGGSLKVAEVHRDAKGQVLLKVVVEKYVPGGAEMLAWRARFWGRVNQPTATDKNTVGRMLVLKDDKGEAIPLGNVTSKPVDDFGVTTEFELTYQGTEKTKPATLVYVGQRMTTIDVPFVIKDVPVP